MVRDTAPVRTESGPRRRAVKFGVFLFVLIGALVGADFALAAAAEHAVSREARVKFALDDDPGVNVHGFPFALQAVRGEYDHITVTAQGVRVGNILRELELVAELRDVHAPLSDVLDGKTFAIRIGDLEAMARIRQGDLARLSKLPNLSIKPAAVKYVESGDEADEVPEEELREMVEAGEYGNTAGIEITARTNIGGDVKEIIAYAIIELHESAVRISPQRLLFGDDDGRITVPEPVRQVLMPQFEHTIRPGSLPFGVQPSGVAVDHGAVVVHGRAADVTFAEMAR